MITCWLYARGDYKGIFNTGHFHALVALAFAFVVFWGYVTFSQYFLIWNANVPEETFWYNIREHGDWLWVGMLLLFGHFFVPFLGWLRYRNKSERKPALIISIWVALIILVDLCYNVLPALKDAQGDPLPFLSIRLLWVLTSVAGVGGVCSWAYLRSLAAHKLIPIRDPRIGEALTYHDATAPEPGAVSAAH
jgi:Na+-driven multidrug efflux pump